METLVATVLIVIIFMVASMTMNNLLMRNVKQNTEWAEERLNARGIANTGKVDRGFMWSMYFRDPLGHRIELACYKFEPPAGHTHADVLRRAHDLRVARGAINIEDVDLADAIEALVAERGTGRSGE